MPFNIVVADDHPLVRAGIRQTLCTETNYRIVAEVASGDEVFPAIQSTAAQLLLLDIDMPGLRCDANLARLNQSHPALKILIVSSHQDPSTIRLVESHKIHGYLLKDESAESLLQAVRLVLAGDYWCSPSVRAAFLQSHERRAVCPVKCLSLQQCLILLHLSEGCSLIQIAEHMCLSPNTTRNYLSMIFTKLGLHTRAGAAVFGVTYKAELTGRVEMGRHTTPVTRCRAAPRVRARS